MATPSPVTATRRASKPAGLGLSNWNAKAQKPGERYKAPVAERASWLFTAARRGGPLA